MSLDKILSLTKTGNIALTSENYKEAVKYINEALDLLEENQNFNVSNISSDTFLSNNNNNNNSVNLQSRLYSKRSVAFLKTKQYYYALEDAKRIINISPNWFKGNILFLKINLLKYLKKSIILARLFKKSRCGTGLLSICKCAQKLSASIVLFRSR